MPKETSIHSDVPLPLYVASRLCCPATLSTDEAGEPSASRMGERRIRQAERQDHLSGQWEQNAPTQGLGGGGGGEIGCAAPRADHIPKRANIVFSKA
ncbi:hypothetical protein Cob_v004567 [Colletotrichum orbiculare MAFF 240422]|uniref:Uncharacterized protein n=1 Tax=Colletotrichum orbiculare (strain 104-T / ATCC 96160 / CBS 514.97 / LARS 414 / MAFF 240422) TaxID=1213857 RepID=A0A484FY06_COLOR|nr:hypothetical protein Cob_v004567 [Colletotrichum orbiculare MAFF 240422]